MVDFYGKAAPSGLEIDSVDTARRLHDGHWFDADTMRFFRTRISASAVRRTHAGLFFVTSEKGPTMPRRYCIRLAYWRRRDDGRWVVAIRTIGDFQAYASREAAVRHMMGLWP